MQILCEPIWHKQFITIGNVEIVNQKLSNCGILTIRSLLDDGGTLKSHKDVEDQYNTTFNVMLYNSIKSAIPRT